MTQSFRNYEPRRVKAQVSILGTTQMHLRSPFIIALWSVMFPGLGHLLLSKYIRGMILFGWEILINLKSNLNLSLYYTFTGQLEMAKQSLDTRWIMLYIPLYMFVVWDSFRTAVDMNNNYVLAAREDAPLKLFNTGPLGFNYLDKSSPWIAVAWSLLSPGAGQLIIHRILAAFFILVWWIVVIYNSNILPAIHATFMGQFDIARMITSHQWMLNIPSLFFFALYDTYTNTVESNKLYDWEQSKFLKRDYQDINFPMPFDKKERSDMYIVSNFEHSNKLELAVTALQMEGIPKENILAVPLDKRNEDRMLFDNIHYSDNISMLDIPVLAAAVFALFGMIYGFAWHWGPVIWTLIGTVAGFGIGLLIKLYTTRRREKKQKESKAEVVVMVACSDKQAEMVQKLLWDNAALGVSKLSLNGKA